MACGAVTEHDASEPSKGSETSATSLHTSRDVFGVLEPGCSPGFLQEAIIYAPSSMGTIHVRFPEIRISNSKPQCYRPNRCAGNYEKSKIAGFMCHNVIML